MVSTDRLIDGMYGGDPPDGIANALRSQVSRLRRQLRRHNSSRGGGIELGGGGELVEFHPAAYPAGDHAKADKLLGEVPAGREPTVTDDPPMASRPYVITTVPDDGPAATVLTMSTVDGAMEGVNEAGLAVALLLADVENAEQAKQGANHPLHRYPDLGALPPDNDATFHTYERIRTLTAATSGTPSSDERIREALDEVAMKVAKEEPWRTLWRTVFDLRARTMTTRFYLGDTSEGTARHSLETVFGVVR